MPKWLQGNVAATSMLWLYAVATGFAAGVGASGPWSELGYYYAFAPLLASWMSADAEKRSSKLYYEYDSLIAVLWPVPLLAYLFHTRGARAWLTLFWFGTMWIGSAIVWFLTSRLCDFLMM